MLTDDTITDIAARAVRVAKRRLRRALGQSPELRRFGIMSDAWQNFAESAMRRLNNPASFSLLARATPKAVLRGLSAAILTECIRAERNTTRI